MSRLWLFDVASKEIEKVPQPATRANDVDAMWIGGVLYFRSDRAGEFNLFSYTPGQATIRQLTTHRDFPIARASAGGGKIVYEQAGYLHQFDPATGTTRRFTIGVSSDLRETRPRFVKGNAMDQERSDLADRRTRGLRVPRGHRIEPVGARPSTSRSRRP